MMDAIRWLWNAVLFLSGAVAVTLMLMALIALLSVIVKAVKEGFGKN